MSTAAQRRPRKIDDPTQLGAPQILAIAESEYRTLFPVLTKEGISSVFHALAKIWYPDTNRHKKEAPKVFAHISALHDIAAAQLKERIENGPGVLKLQLLDRSWIDYPYLKKNKLDVGEAYIANKSVAFAVRLEYADLFENAVRRIKNLHFTHG